MAGSRISQRSSSDVLSGDNRIHDVNALQEIQQPQSGHGPVASQPGPACCEARRKPPSFTETFRRAPSKAHKTPSPAPAASPAPAPSRSLFRSRSLPLSLSLSLCQSRERERECGALTCHFRMPTSQFCIEPSPDSCWQSLPGTHPQKSPRPCRISTAACIGWAPPPNSLILTGFGLRVLFSLVALSRLIRP